MASGQEFVRRIGKAARTPQRGGASRYRAAAPPLGLSASHRLRPLRWRSRVETGPDSNHPRYPPHMPPRTPSELKEQIEKQNAENPPAPGKSRTAEGLEVENPRRRDFLGNLEKASKPDR